jgi:hypothetical protein
MTTNGSQKSPAVCLEHRGHNRHSLRVSGRIQAEGLWQDCEVVNVSAGGAKLQVQGEYRQGQELTLEIDPCGLFPGVVAWVRGGELGLQFSGGPAEVAEALIGLITYG